MSPDEANVEARHLHELFPKQSPAQIASFAAWCEAYDRRIVRSVLDKCWPQGKDGFANMDWIRSEINKLNPLPIPKMENPYLKPDVLEPFGERSRQEDEVWIGLSNEQREKILGQLADRDGVKGEFRNITLKASSSSTAPNITRGRLLQLIASGGAL